MMKSLKQSIWLLIVFLGVFTTVTIRIFPASGAEELDSILTGSDRGLKAVKKAHARFALVIGNANYNHIPTLTNSLNDACDIKNTLQKLNFQVDYLPDAKDRRMMTEAVRNLGNKLTDTPDAVGLFFYAGHAMQIKGINYLIPVEAVIKNEADVEFETFNVNYLLNTLDLAKNGMNIIILDACRNNPYARGFRSVMDRGLAPMDSPTGSIIIFATAPGKTAADGDGRNGTFTKHLLEYIDQPNLTIEQMLKQVRICVIDETDGFQTPWETSSLSGDFCFNGCKDKAAIEHEALQKAEEKLKLELGYEKQRIEKERAAVEAEWTRIKAKKLEMKIEAAKAQQRRDQEALDRIRRELGSLSEQNILIQQEKDRIDRQENILVNENEDQKENKILRLKEEQADFERERKQLEQQRIEAEKARQQSEVATSEEVESETQTSITPMVGF